MGKKPDKSAESGDNFVSRTVKSTVKTVSGIARSLYEAPKPVKKPAEKAPAPKAEKQKTHAPKPGAHPPAGKGDAGPAAKGKQHAPEAQGDAKRTTPPKRTETQKDVRHPPQTAPAGDKHPGNIAKPGNAAKHEAPQPAKPAEKTSLNSYINHLKEKAKSTVNEEIEKVKGTAKFVEDNLHKLEKTATQVLKDASNPKKAEAQKPKPVDATKLTPEERVKSGQFEYHDEKSKVSYKYDRKTGNVQEMQRGDTTTHIKYDKSGQASHMEVKQGNHVLASLDNKDASKLKVDQVSGAVNVEALNKDSKTHVAKESTTYQPDGSVTNVGYDAAGHRTSKVGFNLEGDQYTKKYRVDYVYTKGDEQKEGGIFSVTRNLEEKNPAKQVTEKCWYDEPEHVEKQAPSMKERISRDKDNNTKLTRAFKDGRSEELNLDANGHATTFHVRNPKGFTVKYDVKDDKIVGAKVDGQPYKDANAQEAAQSDLLRMKQLYTHQAKVAESEKLERPVGLTDYAVKESKTGTVVIKTDDGIHSFHSQYGELRDKDKKLIGHLDKDGKITLEKGVTFTIGKQQIKDGTSLNNLEGSSFYDTHDILNNQKALDDKNAPGWNGVFVSADGKSGHAVVRNNVYDIKGEFLGQMDSSGRIIGSVENGGKTTDLNSAMRDYTFIGRDAGQERKFVASANMSEGEMTLDDPPGIHKVEMGMLLVKQADGKFVQKGLVDAPSVDGNGKLVGGSLTLFGPKGEVTRKPLCEAAGTRFDLEVKGEGGVKSERRQGVCLGKEVLSPDNKTVVSGGFFDIQDAKRKEKQLIADSDMKFKEKQNDWVGRAAGGILQVGGKSDYDALKESNELTHRRGDQKLAALEALQKGGNVDLKALGFYDRELTHLTQTPAAKPEHKPPDPKTVLKRPDLKDKQITGKVRSGNEVFNFDKNKVIVDGKAIGEITPDYVLKIEGRPPIDLKQEDRVLMEFKFDGSNQTHQLIGMGRTKVGLNGRLYEGGLVDTKSLTDESMKRELDLVNQIQTYKDGRVLTSGISNAALGDAEGQMDLQLDTFRTQTEGLKKEFKTLFDEGFNTKQLDNNRVDQCTRATQQMMENCRTTTADGTELVQRTTQLHQQANEGIIMGVTTVATMGVGGVFTGLANAGKLANVSRGALFTYEVGATGLVGGTVSVIGRHTEKGGWDEAYRNLASGTMEGMANSLNAFGTVMKAQGLGKAGVTISQLAKADVQVANIAKAGVRVEQLAQGEVKLGQVAKATVTVENLQKGGLTASKLSKSGITAEELQSGAVSVERLMAAGLKEKDLAKVMVSVEELGKTSINLGKVPVALEELQKAGVSMEKLATTGVRLAGDGGKVFTIADQMVLDSRLGQLSARVAHNPMSNFVLKSSLQMAEGMVQTGMYNVAGGMRDTERGLNVKDALGFEKLALGAGFNIAGQSFSEVVGNIGAMSKNLRLSENKVLAFLGKERSMAGARLTSNAVFNDFVGQSIDQFVQRMPSEMSNAYVSGALSAIEGAVQNQKDELAAKLGRTPTEQELYENMNYTKVLKEIHDQGLMAAVTSPLSTLGTSPIHAWSENGAPLSRLPKHDSPDTFHPDHRTPGGNGDATPPRTPDAPAVAPDAPPVKPSVSAKVESEQPQKSEQVQSTPKTEHPVLLERQREKLAELSSQQTQSWKPEYGKELGLKVVGKEGTEKTFLEATKKAVDALVNSGEPGDTRPIHKEMIHEIKIVQSTLADNPEQLKIYNEYVAARQKHEGNVKELNRELDGRLADLQKIADDYCRTYNKPKITLTRGHDFTTSSKGYQDGRIRLANNELLKSKPAEELLTFLHKEINKAGKENESPEYRERAAQIKKEDQLQQLDNLCNENTRGWRDVNKEELGLTHIEVNERLKDLSKVTEKLVEQFCDIPGPDGKPIIEREKFHDIDYVRSKLDSNQLAQYEKYVQSRTAYEKASKTLTEGLNSRLKDLQSIMDQFADANHQPRVKLLRTHEITTQGTEYGDGMMVIGSESLLKSRPDATLREFLQRESFKAGREGESQEFKDAVARQKVAAEQADMQKALSENVWNAHPYKDSELSLDVATYESLEMILRDRGTRAQDLLMNSGKPGDDRPIHPSMFNDHDVVRSALRNNPEQLKVYNDYAKALQDYAQATKRVKEGLDSRLKVLQDIVDNHCITHNLEPIKLTRSNDLHGESKPLKDQVIQISDLELSRNKPSIKVIDLLCNRGQTPKQESEYRAVQNRDLMLAQREYTGEMVIKNLGNYETTKEQDNIMLRQFKAFDEHNVAFQDENISSFLRTLVDGTEHWYAKAGKDDAVDPETAALHKVLRPENFYSLTDDADIKTVREARELLRAEWAKTVRNMSPEERQALLDERKEWLTHNLNQALKDQSMCGVKIVAEPDSNMTGTRAYYQRGSQEIHIRESQLLGLEPLQLVEVAHEAFHLNQDVTILRAAALEVLRKNGQGVSDLSSAELRDQISARYERLTSAPPEQHLVESMLKVSEPWLKERLNKSDSELQADPEYMRGIRLAHNFSNPKEKDPRSDQLRQLIYLLDPSKSSLSREGRDGIEKDLVAFERNEAIELATQRAKAQMSKEELKEFQKELREAATKQQVDTLIKSKLGLRAPLEINAAVAQKIDSQREMLTKLAEAEQIEKYFVDLLQKDWTNKLTGKTQNDLDPAADFEKHKDILLRMQAAAMDAAGKPVVDDLLFANNNPYKEDFYTPMKWTRVTGNGQEVECVQRRVDAQFDDLLKREAANRDSEFFANLVKCARPEEGMSENSSLADIAKKRIELRKKWLEMFPEEKIQQTPKVPGEDVGPELKPVKTAPTQDMAIARLDMRACLFMLEHFKNNDTLGTLTKKEFEESLPSMVRALIKDNAKINLERGYSLYRGNFYELEAHYIQQRMEKIMMNDLKPPKERYTSEAERTEQQAKLKQTFKNKRVLEQEDAEKKRLAESKAAEAQAHAATQAHVRGQTQQEAQTFAGSLSKAQQVQDAQTKAAEPQKKSISLNMTSGESSDTVRPVDTTSSAPRRVIKLSSKLDPLARMARDAKMFEGSVSFSDTDDRSAIQKKIDQISKQEGDKTGDQTHRADEGNDLGHQDHENRQGDSHHDREGQQGDSTGDGGRETKKRFTSADFENDVTQPQEQEAPYLERPAQPHVPLEYHQFLEAQKIQRNINMRLYSKEHFSQGGDPSTQPDAARSHTEVALDAIERADKSTNKNMVDLAWAAAVRSYKQIDQYATRSPEEEARYRQLQERIETEVRARFEELTRYLDVPSGWNKQKPPDAYDLKARFRDMNDSEGKAQQEAFFKRLTKGINSNLLSDVSIAEKPEVLVRDRSLVKRIIDEVPLDELRAEAKDLARKHQLNRQQSEERVLQNRISELVKAVNEKDPSDYTTLQQETDRAINRAMERGRDWIGVPIPDGCLMDQLGCDYLLINKRTGEYHPLDVTVKGNNKSDRLVDCRGLNQGLDWFPPVNKDDKFGKHVPDDRKRWVMVVATDAEYEQAISEKRASSSIDYSTARKELENASEDSLSTAIMATLQERSPLSIFNHPLPPLSVTLPTQQRITAAQTFAKQLRSAGMDDWARDVDRRLVGFLRNLR